MCKVEKILKCNLDSILLPWTSVKIQIMGGKVCLRRKGKTLLGIVSNFFVFKSWPHPAIYAFKPSPPLIWIFTKGDRIQTTYLLNLFYFTEKERKTIKIFAIHIVPASRVHDAVVLKGSDLPELLSVPTWQILGYNFNSSGLWTQIPIQIDEMHYQKWDIIKHVPDCRKVYFRMSYYNILLIQT